MSAGSPESEKEAAKLRSLLQEADRAFLAGKFADAERCYDGLRIWMGSRAHQWPAEAALCLQRLGDMSMYSGRLDRAEAAYQQLYDLGVKNLGPDHPDLVNIATNLSEIRAQRAKPKDAYGGELFERDGNGHGGQAAPPKFGQRKARRKFLAGTGQSKPSHFGKFWPLYVALLLAIYLAVPGNAARWVIAAGDFWKHHGNYKNAVGAYDLAYKLGANSAELLCKRAGVEDDFGRFDEALNDYDAAIQKDPQSAWAYFNRGMIKYRLNEYEHASQDFERFTQLSPKEPDGYVRLGIARAKLGQYDLAIKDYDKAMVLDPTNAEAMYNRGWAQELQYDAAMEKDEVGAGAKVAEKQSGKMAAVDQKPSAIQKSTAAQKPTVLPKEVSSDDAKLAALNDTIQKSPSAQAYCDRGRRFLNANNTKKAMSDFSMAVQMDPKMAQAYLDRGLAFYKSGLWEKAARDYSQSINLDGKNSSAYYRRALAFDRLGKYSLAVSDYQQAGRLNPNRAKLYAALAKADIDRERKSQATGQQETVSTAKGSAVQPTSATTLSTGAHGLPQPAAIPQSQNNTSGTQNSLAAGQTAWRRPQRTMEAAAVSSFRQTTGCAAFEPSPNSNLLESKSSRSVEELREIFRQASDLRESHQWQRAIPLYNTVLAHNPPQSVLVRIYRELGSCYMRTEKLEDSFSCFNRCLALKPDDNYAHLGRAYLYYHTKDYEKALADLNFVISARPNFPSALPTRALVYDAMGKKDLAAQDRQMARTFRSGQLQR